VTEHFVAAFKRPSAPGSRGKFLSRVFGIFSEEIVRIWATDSRAPFEDLGRPTLRMDGEDGYSTLDFTFRSRETGRIYPAEMKCEIEYQDYRYLVLTAVDQLKHHTKPAFAALLAAASRKSGLRAFVQRQEVAVDGAVLVWGAATDVGRAAVMGGKGFFAVLTVADMIADLQMWRSEPYRALLDERRAWSNELYDALWLPSARGLELKSASA
jgi:hypothetical protein